MPQRPGPRRAHKFSRPVLELLDEALAAEPALTSRALAGLLEERLALRVHPRSIERALARRAKKGAPQAP